jgi:hypothetical protein
MAAELRLYLAIFGLFAWVATGVGAFMYRGHLDATQTEAAINKITLAANTKADQAREQSLREERGLRARSDVLTGRLQDQIDATKDTYERARLQLTNAHLPACPIPVSAIGLLYLPPATGVKGNGTGSANSAAGSAGAQGRTVDASAVILNAESNKLTFERNRARLEACVAQYDAVRTTLNGPPVGAK